MIHLKVSESKELRQVGLDTLFERGEYGGSLGFSQSSSWPNTLNNNQESMEELPEPDEQSAMLEKPKPQSNPASGPLLQAFLP